MKTILIILLSIANLQCFSTEKDSLKLFSDSTLALNINTANKYKKTYQYAVPVFLIGYGFTSMDKGISRQIDKGIEHELQEKFRGFSTHIEDKLQYAPVMAVYALNLVSVKGKNNFIDRTAIYLIANSVSSFSVDFLKDKTRKLRPSGSDRRSFPSGHTANAFVAAEFMRQEFKDVSPLYGYIGYSMATATGALRMMNNAHWFSDVLAGAGIGILSAKFSYFFYPWLKKKIIKDKDPGMMFMPTVQHGAFGFALIAPLN